MILIFGLIILSIIEANHDSIIEKIQDKRQLKNIKKWHSIDFLYHFVLAILLTLVIDNLFVLPIYASVRYLVFNTVLNLYMKRPVFYLGTTSAIDKMFRKIPAVPFILAAIVLTVSIYLS